MHIRVEVHFSCLYVSARLDSILFKPSNYPWLYCFPCQKVSCLRYLANSYANLRVQAGKETRLKHDSHLALYNFVTRTINYQKYFRSTAGHFLFIFGMLHFIYTYARYTVSIIDKIIWHFSEKRYTLESCSLDCFVSKTCMSTFVQPINPNN